MIDYIYRELARISLMDMPGSVFKEIDILLQYIEVYQQGERYGKSRKDAQKAQEAYAKDTALPRLHHILTGGDGSPGDEKA